MTQTRAISILDFNSSYIIDNVKEIVSNCNNVYKIKSIRWLSHLCTRIHHRSIVYYLVYNKEQNKLISSSFIKITSEINYSKTI